MQDFCFICVFIPFYPLTPLLSLCCTIGNSSLQFNLCVCVSSFFFFFYIFLENVCCNFVSGVFNVCNGSHLVSAISPSVLCHFTLLHVHVQLRVVACTSGVLFQTAVESSMENLPKFYSSTPSVMNNQAASNPLPQIMLVCILVLIALWAWVRIYLKCTCRSRTVGS